MLKNYLTIAFRNFSRNALYTFLNGFGLVLGLSCSLLILFWVHFESNVDSFHSEGKRIYRAYFNGVSDAGEITFTQGSSPYALYELLRSYDGVEQAAYYDELGAMLAYEERAFRQYGVLASISLFDVFDFPLLVGSFENARDNLQTIFISEELAIKLLGEEWPEKSVGTKLRINDEEEQTVAGVFQNVGSNSSLQFDFILNAAQSAASYPEWARDWAAKGATVFAKLIQGVDPRSVEQYVNPIYEESNGYGVGGEAMMLFPFEKNYLWTSFEQGVAVASGGRILYVRIFFGAALFLLLIACINFVNLNTAQSVTRAKEVGIRKAVGARRKNLVKQFLFESGLLVFLALGISIVLAYWLVPALNELTGQSIFMPSAQPWFWLVAGGLGFFLTFAAGLYPAFVLSQYEPTRTLKSGFTSKTGGLKLREALIVFQLALSAILIISTITVHNQLHLIQKGNLGLDRSNVLITRMDGSVRDQYQVFKNRLEQRPGITHVLRTTHAPVDINAISVGFDWLGKTEDHSDYFYRLWTDANFAEVFGIEMKHGRFFEEGIYSDSGGVVINETALIQMGLEDPVGKLITQGDNQYRILGVMKDFHFKSIHREIEPLMVQLTSAERARRVMVKTNSGQTQTALSELQETWSDLFPGYPLEYEFLDENYARMYQSEMIIGKLAYLFSGIAILISSLGLFGLITFISLQKTKEIGIRKVVGASIANIVGLLSKDFLKLIVLGFLCGVPMAWFLMDYWLQNFAFRVDVTWEVYAFAGSIAITVAILTVSYQSIRAALVNPVKSLRRD